MAIIRKEHRLIGRMAAIAAWGIALAGLVSAASWQVDEVDKSGVGRFSSLKIDRNGDAHVAYVIDDGSRFPLKYGFWDHALKRWFTMTVDQGVGICSLALDSKQRPHISYVGATPSGSKLHHASWDGTAWKKEIIPLDSDSITDYNSIVIDASDHPSISFFENKGPQQASRMRLRNVTWNGVYWQVRTVDYQEGSGKFNAMATDSLGQLHVAFANVSANGAGMRYGLWDGKSWHTEVIDGREQNNGDAVGYSAIVATDAQGNPHVSYMDESTFIVKYAVRKGGHWQVQRVDRVAAMESPDRNSIALDDENRPYIGYYDAGRGELKVAHQEETKWVVETVDANASGFTSSMQIDQGTLWISYADEAKGSLKVARRQIGAKDPPGASERSNSDDRSRETSRK